MVITCILPREGVCVEHIVSGQHGIVIFSSCHKGLLKYRTMVSYYLSRYFCSTLDHAKAFRVTATIPFRESLSMILCKPVSRKSSSQCLTSKYVLLLSGCIASFVDGLFCNGSRRMDVVFNNDFNNRLSASLQRRARPFVNS